MDRLDAMRLFLRVSDAGSFSRAATDLNIGQPTVSRRIQDLEKKLGAELFHRSTRALTLTEAGSRFYHRTQDILSEFDDAEAEARGLDKEPVGMLRISAAASLAHLIITPTITSFLKTYPHIRMDMITEDTYTDLVANGVDIAFRLGLLTDSSLMAKRLMASKLSIWASPEYLAAHGAPENVEDLERYDALFLRHTAQGPNWTLTHVDTKKEIQVKMKGRFRASSGYSLLREAIDGLGLLAGPDWLVWPYAQSGALVHVLPDWHRGELPMSAVWTSGKLRGKARLFVEHVQSSIKSASLGQN